MPDSPTAAPAVVSPNTARHTIKSGPEGGAEPGLSAQELPWNQASVNIRSPLLRLHTGMLPCISCLHARHKTCYLLIISCNCLLLWELRCIHSSTHVLSLHLLIHAYIHFLICSVDAFIHLFVLLLMQHDCPYNHVMSAGLSLQRLWSSADFWNQQQRRQPCEKLQHNVSAKALLKSMHQHQSKCLGLS